MKDKKQTLYIDIGDWINFLFVGYEQSISALTMRTYKGKILSCIGSIDAINKKE